MVRALLTVLIIVLAGCSRVEPAKHAADLRRNLELAPGVEVFAPQGVLLERCRLVASWGLGHEMTVLNSNEPGDTQRARIVLGTPSTSDLSQWMKLVGASVSQGGFKFEGHLYAKPADALIFTIEDPERPGLPLTAYIGNDVAWLARYVMDLTPCAEPGVRSFEDGRLIVQAEASLSGKVQRDSLRNHKGDYRQFVRGQMRVRLLDTGISLSGSTEIAESRFVSYTDAVERSTLRMRTWFEAGPTLETSPAWLHTRVETFTAAHGEPRQATVNRVTGEVNVLFEEGVPHESGAAAALALALRFGGPAHAEWLEHGASLDAANAWWERDLVTWVAHLERTEDSLSVEEILDPNAASMHSPHRVRPLQAMLCRYLRELHGAEGLRDVWAGKRDFVPRTDEFTAWLTEELQGVSSLPSRITELPFLRGVCLLESAAAPHGSDAEANSLAEVAELGANALSLASFTTMLPRRGEFAALPRIPGIGNFGGDVALAATVAEAGRCGLHVLLTPHFMSSPSGSWVGAEVRSSKAHWERYFELRATRLIDHFALLGELCEVDVLSLGSELARVSRTKQAARATDEPGGAAWKLAGWQDNLQVARASFRGALSYSAAWPGEATQVEFWQSLDYVGCNLYDGFLANTEDQRTRPGREQVLQATKQRIGGMLDLAREVQKPLLVTEWGMPSTSEAWRSPRTAAGEVDLRLQAHVLRAMGIALAQLKSENEALRGAFLWNWWTDSRAGGERDSGYTPQNKPATNILRDVFSRL